jgi:hypothetical protein
MYPLLSFSCRLLRGCLLVTFCTRDFYWRARRRASWVPTAATAKRPTKVGAQFGADAALHRFLQLHPRVCYCSVSDPFALTRTLLTEAEGPSSSPEVGGVCSPDACRAEVVEAGYLPRTLRLWFTDQSPHCAVGRVDPRSAAVTLQTLLVVLVNCVDRCPLAQSMLDTDGVGDLIAAMLTPAGAGAAWCAGRPCGEFARPARTGGGSGLRAPRGCLAVLCGRCPDVCSVPMCSCPRCAASLVAVLVLSRLLWRQASRPRARGRYPRCGELAAPPAPLWSHRRPPPRPRCSWRRRPPAEHWQTRKPERGPAGGALFRLIY